MIKKTNSVGYALPTAVSNEKNSCKKRKKEKIIKSAILLLVIAICTILGFLFSEYCTLTNGPPILILINDVLDKIIDIVIDLLLDLLKATALHTHTLDEHIPD